MRQLYNYAFFDEASKREIRRALIKGVCIPGYQVPFASREMPIGRGWGTGGLQITLSLIGTGDVLKVIDQGSDDSVNAVNIKKLVAATTDVEVTEATEEATLIQSRHRIPERPLRDDQILVLQVPTPEPLRSFEPREEVTKRLHAEADYTGAWLELFDQIVKYGTTTTGADHPVLVNGRYVMAPSPILLLDEVTTGLDLSVQAAVLDLIQQIRRDFDVSMLVVSHDLGVIRMLADRTLVMLDGRVVESGLTDQILEDPQHAYTQ